MSFLEEKQYKNNQKPIDKPSKVVYDDGNSTSNL